MPRYEYVCDTCGHRFIELLPFEKASEPQGCPRCEGEGKKQFSVPPIHFKGGGWGGSK